MSADDPFRFKLTDEQRRIVATVRDLTQSEFKPRGLQYMNGAFPWQNIASLAKVGVLGMAVPQAYGGAEFGVFDTALVLEEIAGGKNEAGAPMVTAISSRTASRSSTKAATSVASTCGAVSAG